LKFPVICEMVKCEIVNPNRECAGSDTHVCEKEVKASNTNAMDRLILFIMFFFKIHNHNSAVIFHAIFVLCKDRCFQKPGNCTFKKKSSTFLLKCFASGIIYRK